MLPIEQYNFKIIDLSRNYLPPQHRMDKLQIGWSERTYLLLSIGTTIFTIPLEFWAYRLTNSVGLLAVSIESCVNLVAAIATIWALSLATKPFASKQDLGYAKAEHFSSALAAFLIIIAAASIGFAAWDRLVYPQPLERVGLGLAISLLAVAIKAMVAKILLKAGHRLRSIALRTEADRLCIDVWTSLCVVLGVALVPFSGWFAFDPAISLIVAANIVGIGIRLVRESGAELVHTALPARERDAIALVLSGYADRGIQFENLTTHVAGFRRFVSLRVLVPESWTVKQGRDLCEAIELTIGATLPNTQAIAHLEPLIDSSSRFDRSRSPSAIELKKMVMS
jgi:cation diffusion facilitator family transporter